MTEREIFVAAFQLTDPVDRGNYLDDACGPDLGLRCRVEHLLGLADGAGSFLEEAPALPQLGVETATFTPGDRTPTAGTDEPINSREIIGGKYKLIELIGEGGMGAVFLAKQSEPVKRVVALKLIKAGMDSKQVIARFEAERQALALMDHANIARVLDAGTTSAGRPYFVMELVKGIPITKYCDEHRLTTRQRLELFIPVCLAIQHAHQKGIIHRDLKPSNVPVAHYDGRPVPKVIDFGVAKATGQPLTDKTLVTGIGAILGTPEYMSPEQAEFNQLDIDTRSDIYSLGVLLYELLTGTTPLERKRVSESGILEALRIIREEEVPTLSNRLSTTEELPAIAANRGLEPAKLTRLVRGELDWIVMKALEKDRNRRYETANGLARDVQRYLAGEAVHAVPPSVGYRLRKFARRNKRALVSAALVFGMLLVLVGSLGWMLSDRAARQARTAVEVDQFLQQAESLYAVNRLPEAMAEVQKARGVVGAGGDEILHRRVQQWLTDLDTAAKLEEIRMEFTEREPRDRVYAEYARVFRDYGIDVEVFSTEEAAARIANRHIKLDLVLALDRWAYSLRNDARSLDPARWQRLVEISRAADPDPWRLRYNAAQEANDLPALREIAKRADPSRLRPRTLAALGDSLRVAGDMEAAVAFLRKVQRQYPGDFSINMTLAWCLRSLNPPQWDDAIAFRRVAVALRPDDYAANNSLGGALHVQGKLDEAIACYKKAIDIDPRHGMAHYNLGVSLHSQKKCAEAIACFKNASERLPNDPYPQYYLAWELVTCAEPKLRDPARALALAKKAVELAPKERSNLVGSYWTALAAAHYRSNQLDEALAALQKAMEIRKDDDCRAWFLLAMVQRKLGMKDDARKWYDRAVEQIKQKALKEDEIVRLRAEAAELLGIESEK